MSEQDPRPTELVVEYGGDQYHFKIPTIHDEMRLGMRARSIRQAAAPGEDASAAGLEWGTVFMSQACASFEVLLTKASAEWPFSKDAAGKPVVKSDKFPADKVDAVLAIYDGYNTKLQTFRAAGVANQPPAAPEAVASVAGVAGA